MSITSNSLDLHARYKVKRHGGVAFYIHGFPQKWESYVSLIECEDEDCPCHEDENSLHEYEDGEGEWCDQDQFCGRVIVVMVGDDHKWEVDVDDLTLLTENDYCHECGQIGCTANGRDRPQEEEASTC